MSCGKAARSWRWRRYLIDRKFCRALRVLWMGWGYPNGGRFHSGGLKRVGPIPLTPAHTDHWRPLLVFSFFCQEASPWRFSINSRLDSELKHIVSCHAKGSFLLCILRKHVSPGTIAKTVAWAWDDMVSGPPQVSPATHPRRSHRDVTV
jgi:hypothetical protein